MCGSTYQIPTCSGFSVFSGAERRYKCLNMPCYWGLDTQ